MFPLILEVLNCPLLTYLPTAEIFLKLDWSLDMNTRVFFIVGVPVPSTGFPVTQEFPDALQQTHIPVFTFEFCQNLYALEMTDNMMCAGRYGEGEHDTCQVSLYLIMHSSLLTWVTL